MRVYKCRVCGQNFKNEASVQGHIRMKRDDAHMAAGPTAYDPVDIATSTQREPAPVPQAVPSVVQMQQDPRIGEICTGVECLKAQIEELKKNLVARAAPAQTAPVQAAPAQPAPVQPQPQTSQYVANPQPHDNSHSHPSPATTADVLDHMLTCKDGVCTRVLKSKVLLNWEKLFPNMQVVSRAEVERARKEKLEAAKAEQAEKESEKSQAQEPRDEHVQEPQLAQDEQEQQDADTERGVFDGI